MDFLIEAGVQVAATLAVTLIGVFGAWLLAKIAKNKELTNIGAAMEEAIYVAQQTVGELQQTVVANLKAGHKDGKLTKDEIASLNKELIDMTLKKLSAPAYKLLTASAVDVNALITGAGEDLINSLNGNE